MVLLIEHVKSSQYMVNLHRLSQVKLRQDKQWQVQQSLGIAKALKGKDRQA